MVSAPHFISLQSPIDGFRFDALHAAPLGRSRGGVIVVQEIFGLDRYVHEDVARWAKLGFEVLAPSMFDRQQRGFIVDHDDPGRSQGIAHMTANGMENPVADVQACIDFLAPRGPVFLVGYCFGGLVAWLSAAGATGPAAASSYYGQLLPHAALRPRCPVIVHFGRNDLHIPAEETRASLQQANPAITVFIYEASGHGFNNDGVPAQDPIDARLARQRTLQLFEANGALPAEGSALSAVPHEVHSGR